MSDPGDRPFRPSTPSDQIVYDDPDKRTPPPVPRRQNPGIGNIGAPIPFPHHQLSGNNSSGAFNTSLGNGGHGASVVANFNAGAPFINPTPPVGNSLWSSFSTYSNNGGIPASTPASFGFNSTFSFNPLVGGFGAASNNTTSMGSSNGLSNFGTSGDMSSSGQVSFSMSSGPAGSSLQSPYLQAPAMSYNSSVGATGFGANAQQTFNSPYLQTSASAASGNHSNGTNRSGMNTAASIGATSQGMQLLMPPPTSALQRSTGASRGLKNDTDSGRIAVPPRKRAHAGEENNGDNKFIRGHVDDAFGGPPTPRSTYRNAGVGQSLQLGSRPSSRPLPSPTSRSNVGISHSVQLGAGPSSRQRASPTVYPNAANQPPQTASGPLPFPSSALASLANATPGQPAQPTFLSHVPLPLPPVHSGLANIGPSFNTAMPLTAPLGFFGPTGAGRFVEGDAGANQNVEQGANLEYWAVEPTPRGPAPWEPRRNRKPLSSEKLATYAAAAAAAGVPVPPAAAARTRAPVRTPTRRRTEDLSITMADSGGLSSAGDFRPFRFLDLPAEIRNKVYEECALDCKQALIKYMPKSIALRPTTRMDRRVRASDRNAATQNFEPRPTAPSCRPFYFLTQTNRQIRSEFLATYLGGQEIAMDLTEVNDYVKVFYDMNQLTLQQRTQMTLPFRGSLLLAVPDRVGFKELQDGGIEVLVMAERWVRSLGLDIGFGRYFRLNYQARTDYEARDCYRILGRKVVGNGRCGEMNQRWRHVLESSRLQSIKICRNVGRRATQRIAGLPRAMRGPYPDGPYIHILYRHNRAESWMDSEDSELPANWRGDYGFDNMEYFNVKVGVAPHP